MSDADPFPELDDAACQRALAVLVDIGLGIARELEISCGTVSVPARAAAFDRVALAVRRTIILSRDIAKHPVTRHDPVSNETRRAADICKVVREVEDKIAGKADPAEAPGLRAELVERVESSDFALDLAHRPRAELIEELCRDLGLSDLPGVRKFCRRTPDDIAILCAQAAAAAAAKPRGHPAPA